MKTIRNISMIAVALLLAVTSCKKENDFGGKASIEGTVTRAGQPVSHAIVSMAMDATAATTDFDATTITDESGKYEFNGLLRGDYYVTAEYTSTTGQKFIAGGAHVTIGDKKGTATANLSVE
jgi:hypothetical protein